MEYNNAFFNNQRLLHNTTTNLSNDMNFIIKGREFEVTKDIKLESLRSFFERDIFILIKKKKLPRIGVTIGLARTKATPTFRIKITHNEKTTENFKTAPSKSNYSHRRMKQKKKNTTAANNLYDTAAKSIIEQISELISNYNIHSLIYCNGNLIRKKQRFNFNISFSNKLIQHRLSK